MKVRRLLRYYGALKGADGATVDREIDFWLQRLGLAEWANHRIDALSKGMSQKVQFISTVVSRPELVILDEPFSGLVMKPGATTSPVASMTRSALPSPVPTAEIWPSSTATSPMASIPLAGSTTRPPLITKPPINATLSAQEPRSGKAGSGSEGT